MSSVDINNGDEATLLLDSALLLYRGRTGSNGLEKVYVTRHAARVIDGVPTLLAGQPATKQQLASFARAASKHMGNFGFVHERVIFTAPNTVAWWAPALPRSTWFAADKPIGNRHGEAQHPALLFVAYGDKRYAFALEHSCRPDADTAIFQAPYFNVSDNGWICTGNVDCSDRPNTTDVEKYENDDFFRSRFTHANAKRLIAGGSAVRLWMDLLDGAPFPTDRLIPLDTTVGAVIQRITNRSN
ncbi:PRTRC system protein B [Burkholderia gladioli]|uniref:PRTRC system protein B n=1 Tax=Burkholderia gladioli TaxID=28095 RepID=UPI001641422C|nr:PRTRC system protein B [Burkholderia gladioli]